MATAARDYYEILGVPRDADDKTIKDAFRRLALKYHPDRSTEPDAEERFREIAEAYAVVSDPRKRADYDAHGFPGVAGLSPEDLWAGIDFGDLFGGFGFDLEGGLFERIFGRRARRGPPRGADIEVPVTIPLDRVVSGGEETVAIDRPGPCTTCGGSGARPGTEPAPCQACAGTGRHTRSSRHGNVVVQQVTTCATCGGRGTIIEDPCPDCGGRGEIVHHDAVRIRIPAGIGDGTAVRIPAHGMPSRVPGGEPGDAYVVVETAPDPRFVRRGADLWREEEVTVPDAVLGTSRTVPTLDGDVAVTVPAGTQPGTVLHIVGKGLPRLGRPGRGDLHLSITVRIPEHPTDGERQLYAQLRAVGRGG